MSVEKKKNIIESLSREKELAVRDNADKDPTIFMSGIDEIIKVKELKQIIVD